MLNINFNLKSVKQEEKPIVMVVRWNNKRLSYAILDKIHPKFFETEKGKKFWQRVRSTYPGYSEFNARIDYIESTTGTAFRRFVNDNRRYPEPHELKGMLDILLRDTQEKSKKTLFQFINSFIEEAESNKINRETGKKISKGTIQIYRQTLRRLQEFEVYAGTKLEFDNIDLEFYDQWIEYVSSHLNLANNTVGKMTKTLKAFLNEATERGLNTNMAFRSRRFKVLTESVYKIYLNEFELNELYKVNLADNPKLEQVRDLFLVGCWTGLRFQDLVSIAPENIIGETLHIKTQKTGEVVVIPIHKMVKSVMAKYSAYPNSLPPSICNVLMNRYLKDIAKMVPCLKEKVQVNITKGGVLITESKAKWECVTVHTARRSFATNCYLQGLSALTIMKMTGHKSQKVFISYVKATAEENAHLVQKHWQQKEVASSGGVAVTNNAALPMQPGT